MQLPINRKILILVKTYPAPSQKYIETCCTAGIDDHGNMIRLYPIPFRLMQKDHQYSKWQWVTVDTVKNNDDKRSESFKAVRDSIKPTFKMTDWSEKLGWLLKCPQFNSIEEAQNSSFSLGVIKVDEIVDLEFKPESNQWDEKQLAKLTQTLQEDMFSSEEICIEESRRLEKIPFGFYYHFKSCGSPTNQRIRITDWEIYQLYRNMRKNHPNEWQNKMKDKYVKEFQQRDTFLILGNQHRFQNQWLCIGVVACPKGTRAPETMDLFEQL